MKRGAWSGAMTAALLALIVLVVLAIIGPQLFRGAWGPTEDILSGENLSKQIQSLKGRAYFQSDLCSPMGTCFMGHIECPMGRQMFGSFRDCPNYEGVCCR
jgi:hypothetical protein